jgi:hypothetical protein
MLRVGQDAESQVCVVRADDKTARCGADLTGYAHERRLPLCINWNTAHGSESGCATCSLMEPRNCLNASRRARCGVTSVRGCADDKTARCGADLTGYAHERRLPLCINWNAVHGLESGCHSHAQCFASGKMRSHTCVWCVQTTRRLDVALT